MMKMEGGVQPVVATQAAGTAGLFNECALDLPTTSGNTFPSAATALPGAATVEAKLCVTVLRAWANGPGVTLAQGPLDPLISNLAGPRKAVLLDPVPDTVRADAKLVGDLSDRPALHHKRLKRRLRHA